MGQSTSTKEDCRKVFGLSVGYFCTCILFSAGIATLAWLKNSLTGS